jgi:hypothetical protein
MTSLRNIIPAWIINLMPQRSARKKPASRCVLIMLFVLSTQLAADPSRTSKMQIWVESSDLYFLHSHEVQASKIIRSETIVIDKADGTEISRSNTAPFTFVTLVADGAYFAGLSNFKTDEISAHYNFALFDRTGRIVSRQNITADSGHCSRTYESRGYVDWYAYRPELALTPDADWPTHIIVKSPQSMAEPCEFGL